MRSGRNFPFGWIASLFTVCAVPPYEASGPNHRRHDSQTDGPAVWPVVAVLSLPCLGRILLKGFKKHFYFFRVFWGHLYCSVCLLFQFLLVKEDSCWPNAFNESWEVLLTCQQQPLKMEAVMSTQGIAVLLSKLKSSSVSSWTSEDEFPAAFSGGTVIPSASSLLCFLYKPVPLASLIFPAA